MIVFAVLGEQRNNELDLISRKHMMHATQEV